LPLPLSTRRKEVPADVQTGGGTVRRTDSLDGLGDIVLMPLMLNQKINKCWNINYRVEIYAPTGDYEADHSETYLLL